MEARRRGYSMTRSARWGCLAIWSVALLVGSVGPLRLEFIHHGIPHHLVHGLSFGTLVLLTRIVFPRRSVFVWQVLACLFFGVLIELLQVFVYGSGFEWEDLRDDSFGIAIFTALYTLGRAFRRGWLQYGGKVL